MIESLSKIRKTTIDLTTELGRAPTKQEIAYRLGLSVNKLTSLVKSAQSTISIEAPRIRKKIRQKSPITLWMKARLLLTAEFRRRNLFEDIRKMLSQLSPKERDVLILRYGLITTARKRLWTKSVRNTGFRAKESVKLKTVQSLSSKSFAKIIIQAKA